MATVPHVTSGLGLRKFQADGFLLTRVYMRLVSYAAFGSCSLACDLSVRVRNHNSLLT